MPNILLVPLQMLMRLTQKPCYGNYHLCSQENTNKREKVTVKLLYITCSALNMFVGK